MSDISFGLTTGRAVRSAATVALLGLMGVGAVARLAGREGSPLYTLWASLGISTWVLFGAGAVVIVGFAIAGGLKALALATRFALTAEGLRVDGPAGRYLLAWDNIERVGTLFERDLGIAVRSPEAVLASHEGTAEQRERLERMEPYQGWDFHYFRHELGMPVERVLFLLEQARESKIQVTTAIEGKRPQP